MYVSFKDIQKIITTNKDVNLSFAPYLLGDFGLDI